MVLKQIIYILTLVISFRSLQTYMVLKPKNSVPLTGFSFRSLQTYMVLKRPVRTPVFPMVLDPYKLTWFSNKDKALKKKSDVLDPYKLTWFSNSHMTNFVHNEF